MQRDPLTIKGKGVMTTYFLTIQVSCVKYTCQPASAVQLLVHLHSRAPSSTCWTFAASIRLWLMCGISCALPPCGLQQLGSLQVGRSPVLPPCMPVGAGVVGGGQRLDSRWPAAALMSALAAACRLVKTPIRTSACQAARTPLLMLLGPAVSKTVPTAAHPEEAAKARAVAAVQTLLPAFRPNQMGARSKSHPYPLRCTCDSLPQASNPSRGPGSA